MWPFDEIARGVRSVVEKVVEVAEGVAQTAAAAAGAVGDAIAGAAAVVGGVLRTAADVLGSLAKARLDLARIWVVGNWGDTWYGHLAQGVVDLARIAVGGVELGVEVLGATITMGGQIIGDVLNGDFDAIRGHVADCRDTVDFDAQDMSRDLGVWIIDDSEMGRNVAGAPRTRAAAWSVAGGLRTNRFGTPDPRTYSDTGVRYEFELRDGEAFFRACTMTDAEPPWQKLVFQGSDAQGSMIGFDRRRLGDRILGPGNDPLNTVGPVLPAPRFESICANADRVFAKEKDKDNFYFLLMDELFWGPSTLAGADPYESAMVKMPSNYFKIDPDQNKAGADPRDLQEPLLDTLPKIPQSERHPLFAQALKLGLLGMVVNVQPRLWHRIDCRPPLSGGPPPENLPPSAGRAGVPIPVYGHVTRRSVTKFVGSLQPALVESSIDFDLVLDIGVGNSHFHEPWTSVYGGELRNTRVEYFHGLALGGLSYSMLNGPLSDGDHFADGTCNFYLLARLRGGQDYAVLYCDEQTFFTQRWRLADPADSSPVGMASMNFSIAAALDATRDKAMHAFVPGQFWSPFGPRYLDEHSRMAVSRTVVVVSGTDPHTRHAELYSANVGYGVLDRTWRYRDLNAAGFHIAPPLDAQAKGLMADASLPVPILGAQGREVDGVQGVPPRTVWPQTVRLREDMHLVLTGTAQGAVPGEVLAGVWTQPLLPVDCEVHPSKEAHAGSPAAGPGALPPKPAMGFVHPWSFWRAGVFTLADRFSHLGVYAVVNARTQFYALDVLDGTVIGEAPGTWTFTDAQDSREAQPGQLYIKALKLHWGEAARHLRKLLLDFYSLPLAFTIQKVRMLISVLSAVEPMVKDGILRWEVPPRDAAEANDQLRASRRSMYLRDGVFDLRHAGPLGVIATWHDKRDDDLISLSDLPMETTLVSAGTGTGGGAGRPVRVRFRQQHKVVQPPVVQWARVVLVDMVSSRSDVAQGPQGQAVEIRYRTNRTAHELTLQLYSLHLAALDRHRPGNFVADLLTGLQHGAMAPVPGHAGEWVGQFPVNAAWLAANARYFGMQGRLAYGTSLWLTGPTGLVAMPEMTEFA